MFIYNNHDINKRTKVIIVVYIQEEKNTNRKMVKISENKCEKFYFGKKNFMIIQKETKSNISFQKHLMLLYRKDEKDRPTHIST